MMSARGWVFCALVLALCLKGCACEPQGDEPDPGGPDASVEDGGGDGGLDGGDGGPPVSECVPVGSACSGERLCCTGVCTAAGLCEDVEVRCGQAGAACANGTDCCLNRCEGGQCSAQRCVDTGGACGSNAECCTSNCSAGTCAVVPGAGSCKVEGQACGAGAECCSTNCKGGYCAPAYTCRATDDLCFGDTDCCSSLCSKNDGSAGFCRAPSGGCVQDGLPCSGSSNCCTRVCADPGTGVTVCLPAGGCRMSGSSCLDSQACCGGGTNPNGSVTCVKQAGDTYGRCDNGTSCNPVGNICGAKFPLPDGGTFSVNASQNCCDGKTAVCKLDASGIPRCFGGGSTECPNGYTGTAPCCISVGEVCQFKDQCCNGAPCVPDPSGILRCTASSCVSLGEACTPGATNPCCSGECLSTGEFGSACQLPSGGTDGGTSDGGSDGGTCMPNGQACTSGSQCCSTICNGGVCQKEASCQGTGSVCTTSSDCCTGLSCAMAPGSTSGSCQEATCASGGQACSPTNGCCSGLLCLKTGTVESCDGTTACSCTVIIN